MRLHFALLYTIHRSRSSYSWPPLPISRACIHLPKAADLYLPLPLGVSGRNLCALLCFRFEPHALESFSCCTSASPPVPSHRKSCRLRLQQKLPQPCKRSNPAIWIPLNKSSPMPCGRESNIRSSITTSASSHNSAASTRT